MSKHFTVVAGPNGAGKTTLAYAFLSQQDAVYLGADASADEMRFHDLQFSFHLPPHEFRHSR